MLSNYFMHNITKPYILIKETSMIHDFICPTKLIMFNKM